MANLALTSRKGRPGARQGLGGVNGNRLLDGDRPVHDWYRFVLSFPPHLVREYLGRFGVAPGQRVLDPFCGTGTTLVECKKQGISSIGLEANPMACFAARAKTGWRVDPDGLVAQARLIAESAETELASAGLSETGLPLFSRRRTETKTPLRTLPQETMGLLLSGSISPLPLHKTLVLLDHLNRRGDPRCRDHHLLALAKALVAAIGNLHFGPEVGVGVPKVDAPVLESWLANVTAIARDLREVRERSGVPAEVLQGDAREAGSLLPPCSVDAVITSPPYPNEKDYTRTTRLESVILGFIRDRTQLRAFKQALVRSNTRTVYKGDDDDRWIASHPKIQRLAEEIEARRQSLGKTSGFERMYARVTRLYFGGMARHLASLRRALRPGARLAYVVGDQASYLRVMLRTGQLLGEIAEALGYRTEALDLFRTRLATATGERLREEVLVLRWPGAGNDRAAARQGSDNAASR